MKFTCQTTILAPAKEAFDLFSNTRHFADWQPGFVSCNLLNGNTGDPGAKSKLVYKNGKHIIELTETILSKKSPETISALYEHVHMVNTMVADFIPVNESETKLEYTIEYTRFNGLMPKLMAALMPGVFKKQTQKWLDSFKNFVEKKAPVSTV